jgi:hypothetical protein
VVRCLTLINLCCWRDYNALRDKPQEIYLNDGCCVARLVVCTARLEPGQDSPHSSCSHRLWGLRTCGRLMHDGESLTRDEAIRRHAGEASSVINKYRSLTLSQKNQLVAFLNSL